MKEILKRFGLFQAVMASRTWKRLKFARKLAVSERQNAFSTSFMRCPHQFELLTGPIIRFLRTTSTIEILSLGCSTGAEAYSIASHFAQHQPEIVYLVRGFDVADEVLEVARGGVYTARQVLKNPLQPEGFVVSTFEKESGLYRVRPVIAERVTFGKADVLNPNLRDATGSADIVFAQNFLYHLAPDDAMRAFENIMRLLKPRAAVFLDGMDLKLRAKLTRRFGLVPLTTYVEEIHREAFSERGASWPEFYWGLEPFSKGLDWRRKYCTVFTTKSP